MLLSFFRNHPYIVGGILCFLLLFLLGIFALDVTWSESLFGSAVLSIVGVITVWWRREGF
jgi:hypothetical protein